ncbi:MAG: hypothetical protein HDR22_09920 [Lachnospiraceae bacterium]|nr:hypothetical protein [Lachnospiraceae bacterium]
MIRKLMTRNPKRITVVLCLVLLLLIPVVDVEYYGKKKKQKLDTDKIKQELSTLLCTLESKYGKRPVIYTTYPAYHDFIRGSFDGYDLWIRNVYAGSMEDFLSYNRLK